MKVDITQVIDDLTEIKMAILQPLKRNHFDFLQNSYLQCLDDTINMLKRRYCDEPFHADSLLDDVARCEAELDPSEHVRVLNLQNKLKNTLKVYYTLEQTPFIAPKVEFDTAKLNSLLVDFAKSFKNE